MAGAGGGPAARAISTRTPVALSTALRPLWSAAAGAPLGSFIAALLIDGIGDSNPETEVVELIQERVDHRRLKRVHQRAV